MGQSSELFIEDRDTLSVFERGLTKSEIKMLSNTLIEKVLQDGNVLQVAEGLSTMETLIKEVKADDRFKNYTREEAAKYPKGFVSASGAKIELAETGSSYCFDKCNDIELAKREASLSAAESLVKERKEFLKKVPVSGMDILIEETGEIMKIYPPSKSSTSSYKVSLSNK